LISYNLFCFLVLTLRSIYLAGGRSEAANTPGKQQMATCNLGRLVYGLTLLIVVLVATSSYEAYAYNEADANAGAYYFGEVTPVQVASRISALGFEILSDQLQSADLSSLGVGIFLSPISIYYAVALALNGAGMACP
jgi:hypothetical protein